MHRSWLMCISIALSMSACDEAAISNAGSAGGGVRILSSELDGVRRPHSWARIPDPTGSAPSTRVERFELRNGDCSGSDCVARDYGGGPVQRARIESHNITDLQDGDAVRYSYAIYFPSEGYNFVPEVSTTLGQLYLSGSATSFSGNPIWDFNTDSGGRELYIRMLEPIPGTDPMETRTVSRARVGEIGGSISMDQWHRITVDVQLSSGADGYIKTSVNGRPIALHRGRTTLPQAYLEYDYGIYQKGTNLWAQQHGGSTSGLPPQIVYYSDVQIARLPDGR